MPTSEEILKMRLAKGDIDIAKYQELLAILRSTEQPSPSFPSISSFQAASKNRDFAQATPPPIPSFPKKSPSFFAKHKVTLLVALALIFAFIGFSLLRHPGSSVADLQLRTKEYEKQSLEIKKNAYLAKIQGLEQRLSIVRNTLAATEIEQTRFQREIQTYSMNHKLATMAVGFTVVGGVIIANNKEPMTDGQQFAAILGGGLAAGYALSHAEECVEVADRLAQAITRQKAFDSDIAGYKQQIQELESQIAQEKSASSLPN